MNKKLKIGLVGSVLLLGTVVLSSCTASFCSVKDQAHLLYAYDGGVTKYYDDYSKPVGANPLVITDTDGTEYTVSGVFTTASFNNSQGLKTTAYTASSNGLVGPKWTGDQKTGKVDEDNANNKKLLEYYTTFDNFVLVDMLKAKGVELKNVKAEDILSVKYDENNTKQIGAIYGDLKFIDRNADKPTLWSTYDKYAEKTTKKLLADGKTLDYCPSTDFVALYKTTMNSLVSGNAFRSCLATKSGYYGSYTDNKETILIESKDYGYGWSKGFFEGLLVWPIAAFIDVLANSFGYTSASFAQTGVPQLLAILVVTFVIRSIMLLATFKSTNANAKMTSLQPEIQKIQAKYPNSNTNTYEKQRMAEEMQKLYKKNKINPFSAILVLIIQFPVFICVWGALSGSAALTTGRFLGLDLGASISSVMFNATNWGPNGGYGAVTAFVLFLLMAAAQTVSMLLPQWIQKSKAKKVAKLGKNPAQKSQDSKMKWFTYIMLAMIIIMGFSLVSAMGVYWLVGALFSIVQTVITQVVMDRKKKDKGAN